MPYFNFHLNAAVAIAKDQLHTASKEVSKSLLDDGVYVYDDLCNIKIRSQLTTLRLVLCNLVKYPNQVILYSRQHTETLPQRYNPQQIGIKKIIGVVDKLADAGYLKIKKETIHTNKRKIILLH